LRSWWRRLWFHDRRQHRFVVIFETEVAHKVFSNSKQKVELSKDLHLAQEVCVSTPAIRFGSCGCFLGQAQHLAQFRTMA
jgi:hypothetical protein